MNIYDPCVHSKLTERLLGSVALKTIKIFFSEVKRKLNKLGLILIEDANNQVFRCFCINS